MATDEPQSPVSSEQSPESGETMQSAMIDDQPSPVRHWKSSRKDEPKLSKLRSVLMPPNSLCVFKKVKMLTPSTAKMKITRESSEATLSSDGKERIIVTMRSRSCLAPLSRRKMRRMRRTRSTRRSIGGSGMICSRMSEANWSSREVQTRKKSKRHQLSEK